MMRLLRRRRSCSHGTNTTCSTITIIANQTISPLVGGDYDGPRNDDDDDKQNQNHQQQIQNHQQEVQQQQQQQQQLHRYHHNHRSSSSTPYSPLSSPFSLLLSSSSPLLSSYPSYLSFSTTTGGKGGSVASSASTFESSSSSSSSTEEAIAVAVAEYNQKKKEKEKKKEEKKKKKEKDDTSSSSNPFLDHLGKVFLLAIASVIATLVRSSYSTSNRNKIRDFIEESSVCDPNEIEEFRTANAPKLTIEVMRKLISQFYQSQNNKENNTDFSMNPSASSSASHKYDAFGEEKQHDQYLRCTYDDFIKRVRKIMATQFDNKGQNEHVGGIGGVTLSKASDSFTIESGHIMDRLIESVLESRRRNGCLHCIRKVLKNNHEEHEPDELLPIALFWTALIAGMNGSVTDRIRILHEVLVMEEQCIVRGQTQQQDGTTSDHILAANAVADAFDIDVDVVVVPFSRVRDMVGYLQETCQLPPDTQIVMTETKYPTQQYKRASPSELVPTVKVDDDKEKVTTTTTTTDDVGGENSNDNDHYGVDVVEFAAILRTKSVCAWGECYMKRKPGPEEFIIDVVNNQNQNENNHSENGMHNYPSPSPTTLSSN